MYVYDKNYRAVVPAEVAGEELARIRNGNGGIITPQTVVDESRPEDAPLHPVFEWDDYIAAEEYRKTQARKLIRVLRYVPKETPNTVPERVYVNIPKVQEQEQCYQTLQTAVSDPEKRAALVARAWQDLVSFKARYLEILKACEDESLRTITTLIEQHEYAETA